MRSFCPQIGFTDVIVLPLLKLLSKVVPTLDVALQQVDANKQFWRSKLPPPPAAEGTEATQGDTGTTEAAGSDTMQGGGIDTGGKVPNPILIRSRDDEKSEGGVLSDDVSSDDDISQDEGERQLELDSKS